MPTATLTVLAKDEWLPKARAHAARADAATKARRERAARGGVHAVDDFLYDYYSTRPSLLRRWHPGPGVVLMDAPEHASWRWYSTDAIGTQFDADDWWSERGTTARYLRQLMVATASRPPRLGCFGLHEWAMVYRSERPRHDLPLRLGTATTNAVVEASDLACTHFDAFRFFTHDAAPRNAQQLARSTQAEWEQPGCLHATMDLYKWCAKLSPAIPSELQQDCFELAVEVRRVDMRASPYDVSSLGLAPIAVETAAGKAEYASLQRGFADRGARLRERIVEAIDRVAAQAGVAAPAE